MQLWSMRQFILRTQSRRRFGLARIGRFYGPGRLDVIGFGGSWVGVGVILMLLWLLATVGS